MDNLITLDQYCADPQTGVDRRKQYPDEWTAEVEQNAINFLEVLNRYLQELGLTEAIVSSGWRPTVVNGALPNSAKRSLHMVGKACDIKDNNGDLDKLVGSNPDLLRKHGMFQEAPAHTPGWTHLDVGTRADRPSRQFNP